MKYLFSLLFILGTHALIAQDTIEVEVLSKSVESWNGDQLPDYHDGIPEVTILKITIPPKTKLKWHKHLVINAGILLKGQLSVFDEKGNVLKLEAGDTLVELVNAYHYGENFGNMPVEIVVFYAGTQGVPITVLKDGASH